MKSKEITVIYRDIPDGDICNNVHAMMIKYGVHSSDELRGVRGVIKCPHFSDMYQCEIFKTAVCEQKNFIQYKSQPCIAACNGYRVPAESGKEGAD